MKLRPSGTEISGFFTVPNGLFETIVCGSKCGMQKYVF